MSHRPLVLKSQNPFIKPCGFFLVLRRHDCVIQFDFHEPVLLPKRTHDRIRRYQHAVKLAIKLRTYAAPFLLRIEPHYFQNSNHEAETFRVAFELAGLGCPNGDIAGVLR